MAWKIERWMDEIFPGKEKIYSEYRDLPPRELSIVSAAVLDVALAELLTLRLVDSVKEVEAFLGLDGDGRAPCGSFGARIQLATLVGVLTQEDAAILRAIKDLRNVFAHRVHANYVSPEVLKLTTRLLRSFRTRYASLIPGGVSASTTAEFDKLERYLPLVEEAGQGLLLMVFTVYQAYFHRLHSRILRLEDTI